MLFLQSYGHREALIKNNISTSTSPDSALTMFSKIVEISSTLSSLESEDEKVCSDRNTATSFAFPALTGTCNAEDKCY